MAGLAIVCNTGSDIIHLDNHTLRNERDRLSRMCDRYAKQILQKHRSQATTWRHAASEMDALSRRIEEQTLFLRELEEKEDHDASWTRQCILAEKVLADLWSKYYRLYNDYYDYWKDANRLAKTRGHLSAVMDELCKRSL